IKSDGLQVTIITYGDRKAETSPYIPLSDVARASLQDEVDAIGRLFVETVARNRGIADDVIRKTQAACFMAPDGVRLGLADAVAAPDAAFDELMKIAGV
ncbi:S49 family peptidase, partial [Salmonella enterica subsp. enterica serovar Pomona]|nr:S49 family peptidase [Salmonella enterica subsp. enterica serovar Pomona]